MTENAPLLQILFKRDLESGGKKFVNLDEYAIISEQFMDTFHLPTWKFILIKWICQLVRCFEMENSTRASSAHFSTITLINTNNNNKLHFIASISS